MKSLLAVCLTLVAVSSVQAGPQLLFNGDFELDTPTFFYYDGSGGPNNPADVPGWVAFSGGDSSSWVQVSEESGSGNWILNLSGSNAAVQSFVGLAGIQTAPASRPAVMVGANYHATVTYDNYFAAAGISYFIDWFNAGGTLLSSAGGPLGDPNGPLTFAPTTQTLEITGIAPASAASAGVRFQSANPAFAGASADNFHFGIVPEPSGCVLAALGGVVLAAVRRRRR